MYHDMQTISKKEVPTGKDHWSLFIKGLDIIQNIWINNI